MFYLAIKVEPSYIIQRRIDIDTHSCVYIKSRNADWEGDRKCLIAKDSAWNETEMF